MAHFAGLVAAGLHPNPVPHSRLRHLDDAQDARRPARRLRPLHARSTRQALDRALFPGMQGGPLEHTIAAKATCFRIAATDAFREYQRQVRANADALAAGLIDGGFDVLTGGTDTHLVQLDLRATEWTGLAAQERLEECRLTVNRNTVPFDERPPMVASGVRLGTPAATMRGFDEDDFREVASIIVDALARRRRRRRARAAARAALCERRPLYPGFRGYTTYVSVSVARHTRSRTRSSGTSWGCCATSTPTPRSSAGSSNELTLLLTYEATKEMPTRGGRGRDAARARRRASASRARRSPSARSCAPGIGMLDGVLSLIPVARVGFIGLYRNEETLEPVEYYVKLPADIAERDVLAARPDARDRQLDRRRRHARSRTPARANVALIALIAAPEGIAHIEQRPPRRAASSSPRSTRT